MAWRGLQGYQAHSLPPGGSEHSASSRGRTKLHQPWRFLKDLIGRQFWILKKSPQMRSLRRRLRWQSDRVYNLNVKYAHTSLPKFWLLALRRLRLSFITLYHSHASLARGFPRLNLIFQGKILIWFIKHPDLTFYKIFTQIFNQSQSAKVFQNRLVTSRVIYRKLWN